MLKEALDQLPVGARIPELEEILRAQHPEFFENHPNPALASLLEQHFGIEADGLAFGVLARNLDAGLGLFHLVEL